MPVLALDRCRFKACLALVALAGAARAHGGEPPADEWRAEKIVRIMAVAALPGYADTHCLGPATRGSEAQGPSQAILLRFRVGRAHFYQAFPVSPSHEWQVGDFAEFVPETCHIRRLKKP